MKKLLLIGALVAVGCTNGPPTMPQSSGWTSCDTRNEEIKAYVLRQCDGYDVGACEHKGVLPAAPTLSNGKSVRITPTGRRSVLIVDLPQHWCTGGANRQEVGY